MILYSLLFLTLFSNLLDYCVGQQCDANGYRRFDTTFAKLLTLGGSGRSFPENKQDQLKKFCDQSYEYILEIDKYKNKCMDKLPKQVTGVIVYSVRSAINRYCKKDSRKLSDLIESTSCPNRAKKEYDQCYTTMIDNFQSSMNAPEKKRVPLNCCHYHRLYECFREKALKNKNCDEDKVEKISLFIKELFGNVVDLLCNDYNESSDLCEKLGPAPKKKKSQRRTKSFVPPMIDTFSSIKDQ